MGSAKEIQKVREMSLYTASRSVSIQVAKRYNTGLYFGRQMDCLADSTSKLCND